MHDYSRLPTLVLNEIFGYLSVKERVKCGSVCRYWRMEVELKEKTRDSLVLHLGPYLWNIPWSLTNKLMRFENSFEVKQLAILKHPLTRRLLAKTKKLAIVEAHNFSLDLKIDIGPYLNCFSECEEIEIRHLYLMQTQTFDLPKLKRLVIKNSPADRLILDCPLLETLFWSSKIEEIQFKRSKKLKRLCCFGWPVRMDGKFESLEYLNLFIAKRERVNDRLLDLMPRLKRLVLYLSDPQAGLKSIREQQERCGLWQLEILFAGFSEQVEIALYRGLIGVVAINRCIATLFDNYPKLVENSPWKVWIDYSTLFDKFKILPSSFFERFSEPFTIEISEVTSYTHLFEFLRHYPFVEKLKLHFSKVNASLILDRMRLLQPSLNELTIYEERPSILAGIDLSFMRLFDFVYLRLECTHLPIDFLRKLAANRGEHFKELCFRETRTDRSAGRMILIFFFPEGFFLTASSRRSTTFQFSSIEKLIVGMKNFQHFKEILFS